MPSLIKVSTGHYVKGRNEILRAHLQKARESPNNVGYRDGSSRKENMRIPNEKVEELNRFDLAENGAKVDDAPDRRRRLIRNNVPCDGAG